MAEIGAHGRSQREVLRGASRIAGTREGKPEPELRVVVGGASLDDAAEVPGRGRVLASIELSPRKRLQDAPGPRLSGGGPFEQLGSGGRAAAAEQVEATLVELMGVSAVRGSRIWSIM